MNFRVNQTEVCVSFSAPSDCAWIEAEVFGRIQVARVNLRSIVATMLVGVEYGCQYFFGRTAMSTRYVARGLDLRDSMLLKDSLGGEFRLPKRPGSEADSEEPYLTDEDEAWREAEDRVEFANFADPGKTRPRNPFAGYERYLRMPMDDSFLILEHSTGSTLCSHHVQYCIGLLKRNMEDLYAKAKWPLELSKKKEELEDASARLLLIRENILMPWYAGFVHFRFLREDSAAVLYLYGKSSRQVKSG